MKRNLLRSLSLICISALCLTLFMGKSVPVSAIDFSGQTGGITIGKSIESVNSIEATVNPSAPEKWKILDASNVSLENKAISEVGSITESVDGLPVGSEYIEFTTGQGSTLTFVSEDKINASEYGWNNLKLSYWIYDEDADNTTIFNKGGYRILDGDKAGYQFATVEATAVSGKWQKMEYSLKDKQGTPLGNNQSADAGNRYELADAAINSLKYISIFNARYEKDGVVQSDNKVRIAGLTLSTTDGTKQWKFDFSNAKNFAPTGVFAAGTFGIVPPEGEVYDSKTNYTAPPAGTNYFTVDSQEASKNVFSVSEEQKTNINIAPYKKENLTVEFWAYSKKEGSLFTNGLIRLANSGGANNSDPLMNRIASKVYVAKGWNKISIPLTQFCDYGANENGFVWANGLCTFKFHGVKVAAGNDIKISDVYLCYNPPTSFIVDVINNNKSDWTVEKVGFNDKGIPLSQNAISFTTTQGTKNPFYIEFNPIDLSKYASGNVEIKIKTYVWAENAGQFASGGGFVLYNGETNANNGAYINSFLQVGISSVFGNLVSGWNVVEYTSDKWTKIYNSNVNLSTGNPTEEQNNGFNASLKYISQIKFSNFNPATTSKYKIAGFEITLVDKNTGEVIETAYDSTNGTAGSMIVSNTGIADQTDAVALYLAEERYPAVRYGNKEYVLKKALPARDATKVKAEIADGNLNFYIGDDATPVTANVTETLGKITHRFVIGSDVSGKNKFNGSIKNISVNSGEFKCNLIYALGDVTGDDNVDKDDLAALRAELLGMEATNVNADADTDVNLDMNTDICDLVAIAHKSK